MTEGLLICYRAWNNSDDKVCRNEAEETAVAAVRQV